MEDWSTYKMESNWRFSIFCIVFKNIVIYFVKFKDENMDNYIFYEFINDYRIVLYIYLYNIL